MAEGLPLMDQRMTVGSFLTKWLETIEPRLRPSTFTRYKGLAEHQIIPQVGRVRLSRLSPADVASMLAKVQQEGRSPRTAAHCRAVLRAALSDAEKWGQVSRNAAKIADPPRVPHPQPMTMAPEEVNRMLEAMAGPDIANVVTVALWTGLRQGELLGSRWPDVDWQAGELHVTQALQRVAGEYRLVEVKSSSSRRTVRLTSPALEALQAERQKQLERRLASGGRWREPIPDLVFTSGSGQPRNGPAITHRFEKALISAGLPPMRFHHLRHLHGSLLLASGVDLATVSHMLGHSSVALTASTYAGVLPSLRQDAANRLEQLLKGS
jgi:integrase